MISVNSPNSRNPLLSARITAVEGEGVAATTDGLPQRESAPDERGQREKRRSRARVKAEIGGNGAKASLPDGAAKVGRAVSLSSEID